MIRSAGHRIEQRQRPIGSAPRLPSEPDQLVLRLPSGRAVAAGAASAIGMLAALGAVAAVVEVLGATFYGSVPFVAMFHLDRELGIPATASMLGLTGCAVLLLVIAASLAGHGLPDAARWRWLGIGFFYLAIDEGARIHENLNGVVDEFVEPVGVFRFGWVVVGIVVVLGLAVVYLPAVLRLPGDIRTLVIVSAGLFVGGALAMEMVGGVLLRGGEDSPAFLFATWLEETGEMAGVGLFFYTLWRWWQRLAPLTSFAHTQRATRLDTSPS